MQFEERPAGRPAGRPADRPAWQLAVESGPGPGWASSTQVFPPLGSQPTEIDRQDNRKLSVLAKSVLGGRSPIVPDSPVGMGGGSSSVVPQCPELGKMGGGCGLPEGIGGLHRK